MDGVIVINKEKGFTSFDVIAKLRGILHQKKIGHTGTLDPDATGVLPVCLGKATKLCDMITDREKEYRAVLRLGISTDTEDMTGRVLQRRDFSLTEEEIRTAVTSFIGEYDQVPPMYSAIKIDGKKLYQLARAGEVVERSPRHVEIFDINIEEIDPQAGTAAFTVRCGKGTYIRSLCRDIGEKLGCGAAMESLVRTKVSPYTLDDALSLAEVERLAKEETLSLRLIPVRRLLSDRPVFICGEDHEKALKNGNELKTSWGSFENEPTAPCEVLVLDAAGEVTGLYIYNGGTLKPSKMLL